MSEVFALELGKWFEESEQAGEKAVAGVIVQAFQGVTSKTPVDTGRARSNWNISSNEVDTTTRNEDAAPGNAATLASANNDEQLGKVNPGAAALVAGADLYIANNLPYIRRLEYGHSQQSEAMLRRTITELRAKYQG